MEVFILEQLAPTVAFFNLFILYNIFISSVIIYNIENDLFMHLLVIHIALNIKNMNILIRIYKDNF